MKFQLAIILLGELRHRKEIDDYVFHGIFTLDYLITFQRSNHVIFLADSGPPSCSWYHCQFHGGYDMVLLLWSRQSVVEIHLPQQEVWRMHRTSCGVWHQKERKREREKERAMDSEKEVLVTVY